MTTVAAARSAMRLRGRSYMAFVLTPEPPVADWLAALDAWLKGSAGFFAGRPAVLDLSRVTLSSPAIAHLIHQLEERNIRVMGLEGADPSHLSRDLPPLLKGGRPASIVEAADAPARTKPTAPPEPTSLLIENPVRSGQSVVFPAGDIIVLGSVSSGAEVIAGGSIHVYGTLRGRAMAGATGNPKARIFCQRIEAELLAIDGYYRTADDMDASLRGRAVHVWLEGEMMKMAALGPLNTGG